MANEAPEKVLESMKRITDGLCELAVKYIEAGLDGVFVASWERREEFGLTREQFLEWGGAI